MFTEIQDTIITALEGIKVDTVAVFKTVDVWQGEIEDLLSTAHKLPSAHVIMSVVDFDEPKTIRGELAPAEVTWAVVLMSQNLRDRKSGAVGSLALIEKVIALNTPDLPDKGGLTRLDTGHGRLWPSSLQLLGVEHGKAAYGIQFYNKKGH